jgi:hypothetical protein
MKTDDPFIAPTWRSFLEGRGLAAFDPLWRLEAPWFEPPNQRRGGWSGVARVELEGAPLALFLKRQENHLRRSLRYPFGEPTFAAEFRNLLAAKAAGAATLEPVFYGQRKVQGGWQAILITEELAGFRPLNLLGREWREEGWSASRPTRREILAAAAGVVRRLHQGRLVHNALHPKHLMVRVPDQGPPEVRLIDLEKMRRVATLWQAARRDLDSLNRRSRFWSRSDRLRFLKHYLGTPRLDASGKALWRALARRWTAAPPHE